MRLADLQYETACYLLATGHSPQEVADTFEKAPNWVHNFIYRKPEYRLRIEEIKKELHTHLIDDAASGLSKWNRKFDDGIKDAIGCLHDAILSQGATEWKGSDRIKAATAWLDRSPSAPKSTTRQEEERINRLVFEAPVLEGIIRMAAVVGGKDLLDVIDVQCQSKVDTTPPPLLPSIDDVKNRYEDTLEEDE